MVKISDIAEHCHVSAATVSYVLNGRGNEKRISAAMQEKVLSAAQELGYRQRKIIRTSTHLTIAVYWPRGKPDSMIISLLEGIDKNLSIETAPIDMMIRTYELDHIDKNRELLHPSSCDACVIFGTGKKDLQFLEQEPTAMPAVLINRTIPGYSSVTVDDIESGRLMAAHAVARGEDKLALVLSATPTYWTVDCRSDAIISYCEERGISLKGRIFYCQKDIDGGYEFGWDLVRSGKLPKVIMCLNDMVGLGIMSALNEAGIQIGRQVELLSIATSDARLFARSYPAMTVIDWRMSEVWEKALKIAIDLASHRVTVPQEISMHPQIIYRKSSPIGHPATE